MYWRDVAVVTVVTVLEGCCCGDCIGGMLLW